MNLYERYIDGQTKQVYQEIYDLGQDAFLSDNLHEIEKVLTETFQRVSYNLDAIYKYLKDIKYLFPTTYEYNFERPLNKPLPNTDHLLQKLDIAVKQFGFVPLSLKFFYKIVGSVNFGWDYSTNQDLMWNMADPIEIISLDDLVAEVATADWKENIQDNFLETEHIYLELAPDNFHKDNISGGLPYSIKITKLPSIDADFLNEPNGTTFIDYLRICFEHCGFPGITNPEMKNNYEAFFNKVKPKLKQI